MKKIIIALLKITYFNSRDYYFKVKINLFAYKHFNRVFITGLEG